MFIRIMVIVGVAILLLAYMMLMRASRTDTLPLPATPLGTSTLSHGGPPVASPSQRLPDHAGDGARDLDRPGDAK